MENHFIIQEDTAIMKCVIVGDDTDLEDRIKAFISDKGSEMVTGRRRMGREALTDLVLKIAMREGIRCGTTADAPANADIVIIENWENTDFGSVSEKWPDSDIFYSQDLCHQVPAIARAKR